MTAPATSAGAVLNIPISYLESAAGSCQTTFCQTTFLLVWLQRQFPRYRVL